MATEDYSALEHIAKSLYLHRWREPLFAMLTAYFEDSGSHGDTKALVICGYVSTVDQWMHFEKDFRRVLGMPQFGLDELHMKTLRNNKKFKDNLGLQRDLFERVSLLLRCRIMETFGGSVLLDDYDRMNQEYAIRETLGPPLVMAAQLAIPTTSKSSSTKALLTGGYWMTVSMKSMGFDYNQPRCPRRQRYKPVILRHGSYTAHYRRWSSRTEPL